MNEVYVVFGVTDNNEDVEFRAEDWVVCAYPEREAAEMHCRLLAEKTCRSRRWSRRWTQKYREEVQAELRATLDRRCTVEAGGVRYWVEAIPFARHPDEYQEAPR